MLSVPSSKVGMVMGRGGETIREICLVSGAHCQVDKAAPEDARQKNILIKGRPEAVQRAKVRSELCNSHFSLCSSRSWSLRGSAG